MITYKLTDNVVTHFPAIFKGLGSKPSVIHIALDVELHGGVLAVRVAGGRPIECGKCSRSTVIEFAAELRRRKHRVVLVEERRADLATGFTATCARSEWKLLWWRPKA